MCSNVVVVTSIGTQDPTQMGLPQHNDVVLSYSGGRETIEGTLESQNTGSKACEVDEAIRGVASAKGISARNWSRPSAIELNPTRYTKEPGPPCAGPFLRPRSPQSVISLFTSPRWNNGSLVTRSPNLSPLSELLSRVSTVS